MNTQTLDPRVDGPRLGTLLGDVLWVFRRGGRWTLGELRDSVGHGSEAGISARIREARGLGYRIEKGRRGAAELGLWEYWMDVPARSGEQLVMFGEEGRRRGDR